MITPEMFVQLTILVLAGLAGPILAHRRRGLLPVVVGELLAGIVLGRTGLAVVDVSAQPLPSFRALGFAMLMLMAGAHVDVASPAIRRGLLRGLLAVVIVVVVAAPVGLILDHAVGLGHPALLVVLIAGSSAAVVCPILEELGLSGDRAGFAVAWVAVADAAAVVVMPLTLAGSGNLAAAVGGDAAIIAAAVVVTLAVRRARHLPVAEALRSESLERGWALQLRYSVLLLLGLSAIAERATASTLVAGFVSGMVIVRLREPDRLALQLMGLAGGFFVPIFFVLLGAELDLRALVTSPSALALAVSMAGVGVLAHVVAAIVAGTRARLATGLTVSAQLGMPAAAASLGLATQLLTPAQAAALVAAGCLTLIPATVGAAMLSRDRDPAPR